MLTGYQLAEESGLTYRQVDYWTTRGVLRPVDALASNPGSGRPRNFDPDEARVARTLGALRELGVRLELLAEIADQLRGLHEHEWHGQVFVNELGMLHRHGPARGWAIDLDAIGVGC